MEKFEREFQSGALWKNYEYWKMNQKIAEMMRTFSHTTTEIVNDSNSLDREWEFEVQGLVIELIRSMQERVRRVT